MLAKVRTPNGASHKGVLQLEATFIDVKTMYLHQDSNIPSVVQSSKPNQTCPLHTEYWCSLQPNNSSGVTQFIDNRH